MVTFSVQPNLKPPIKKTMVEQLSFENTETSVNNNVGAFYDKTVIFITGATGFVGKALLEKLLRSCTGIKLIYILIRPKRGQGIEQRMKELIKNPVFDKIREKTPEYFDKIIPISGDVSHANLGISEVDKFTLISTVNIAFHSAATVRFNETLKDAVILNTAGTKRIIKLCKEMKKLKSFVHVSTAFSNADKRDIDEIVYNPPFHPNTIIKCVETLPSDIIHSISEKIQGKHPNTYTLTKAMAEFIILENSSDFPVAIVRPSIVTAAWKEPFPGWVDNISGITGIMMEIGRGTIRSIICEENYIIDAVPVDMVVCTLISAAWHNAVNRNNTVRVYNCTSGQINGIKWKNFGDLTLKYAIKYPSKYTTLYPGFQFRTNKFIHLLYHWCCHIFPAAILDVLLYFTRRKPIMLRICNKFAQAAKHGTFFAINEWKFANNSLKHLIESLNRCEDKSEFLTCDISEKSEFNWEIYVKNYMLGIRKYVLKDDESSLENARNKLKRLLWTKRFIQITSFFVFLKTFHRM